MHDDLVKEHDLFLEEGKKYDRLVGLARRVHQPTIVPLWNLKIISADGDVRVNRDSYGHSFTRNLYNCHAQFSLFRQYLGHNDPVPNTYVEGGLAPKTTGGLVVSTGFRQILDPEPQIFGGGYGVTASDTSYGFVAGTGTTAEDFNDFVIEGLIPHGVGGGQLDYKIATLTKGWDVIDRFKFSQWERSLLNSSGATINVGNVAMYFAAGGGRTYCYVREVLAPVQPVLHTETLSFTYEFRMYFP